MDPGSTRSEEMSGALCRIRIPLAFSHTRDGDLGKHTFTGKRVTVRESLRFRTTANVNYEKTTNNRCSGIIKRGTSKHQNFLLALKIISM